MWSHPFITSMASFSRFPFTVALGDPFVCVMLLPCIGWTVNRRHFVVGLLDVQYNAKGLQQSVSLLIFFLIHLFPQVLAPSTDPGLLLWTPLFSHHSPMNQTSLHLLKGLSRDIKSLTSRTRLLIWLLVEENLERNNTMLITSQMTVLPTNQTKSPQEQRGTVSSHLKKAAR